jgi:predicted transposase YdaD
MGVTEMIIQEYYQNVLIKGREEGLNIGREEGREKGREKGREEAYIEVVTKLHTHNPKWSDEIIADLAGTSIEKVKSIRASLKKAKK